MVRCGIDMYDVTCGGVKHMTAQKRQKVCKQFSEDDLNFADGVMSSAIPWCRVWAL